MNRILRFLLAAAASAAALPALAGDSATNGAIDEAFGEHAKYEVVIVSLQKAVAAHDADAVAKLVSYPIRVSVNGRKTTIRDAKAFVAHYDAIIAPDIAAAVRDQKYEDLFVNSQGVMFGNGQVWINGVCKDRACKAQDVKVITIQHTAR